MNYFQCSFCNENDSLSILIADRRLVNAYCLESVVPWPRHDYTTIKSSCTSETIDNVCGRNYPGGNRASSNATRETCCGTSSAVRHGNRCELCRSKERGEPLRLRPQTADRP